VVEPSIFFARQGHRLRDADLRRPRPNPTFGNPPWPSSPLRVLVLRLSPYRDVDRSTPHLFLAQAARRAEPRAYLDFCFFPAGPDRRLLEEAGVPLIAGIESNRPLADFDLALASCSYHLGAAGAVFPRGGRPAAGVSGRPARAGHAAPGWGSLPAGAVAKSPEERVAPCRKVRDG
jgi:hypothetical protein